MGKWKKPFVSIAKGVKNPIKKTKLIVKQRLGWLQQPIILPFRGYGNNSQVTVMGRVLEDNGLAKAASKDRKHQNIWAMVKRFVSDEIPFVNVKIKFMGMEQVVATKEDGTFITTFDVSTIDFPDQGWYPAYFELLDKVKEDQGLVKVTGEVLILKGESNFGVISDVDDTFLVSHATKTARKLRLMLLKNARTRMPFPGVAAFYRFLFDHKDPYFFNPIFYVSSSEWNLYDLLIDFCKTNGIPKGPFLLQDLKTNVKQLLKSGGGSHMHKYDKILTIMEKFPEMKFILIGDSGQHDAEIYQKVANKFPDRILTIYIRDVKKARHAKVINIAEDLKKINIDMVLASDTLEAAVDAIEKGYIAPAALHYIKDEKYKDEHQPSDLKQLIIPEKG